ncbi:class I SAM-dependent methyltransferase [Streptomyces sp. 15-116A]|uniref:class I SAM-dependent methyltransferase n=1 Tax=Streptomyces sp. 15-116A TaxID=2259035 RepID=UPI0021B24A13|nr:class I SAM-dependent methyltransferase [Streptomyces sp. 15-116A]MCT7351125.1 class I SAM-dependent methyltransferase [Streptomyces sp. 15-116A]
MPDVSCGTGGTTQAVALPLGPAGHCVGIDISEPAITAARARAEREQAPVTFVSTDAQEHAFEPAGYDAVTSRSGVMFFNNSVQAFATFRRTARDGTGPHFIAWHDPDENPSTTTAERAGVDDPYDSQGTPKRPLRVPEPPSPQRARAGAGLPPAGRLRAGHLCYR